MYDPRQGRPWSAWGAVIFGVVLAGGFVGCATAPAIGGVRVYAIRARDLGERHAYRPLRGKPDPGAIRPAYRPGRRLCRRGIWLGRSSAHPDRQSPVVFEADAEALKDGILVERSWNTATVHNVTDDELAAGGRGRPRPRPTGSTADLGRAWLRSTVSRLAAHTASTACRTRRAIRAIGELRRSRPAVARGRRSGAACRPPSATRSRTGVPSTPASSPGSRAGARRRVAS